MDFALDSDQQLLVTSVRRFAEAEVAPHAAASEKRGAHPEGQWRGLVDLGVLEAQHLGPVELVLVTRELARADASLALLAGGHLAAARYLATAAPGLLPKDGAARLAVVGHGALAERHALPQLEGSRLDGSVALAWGAAGAAALVVLAGRADAIVAGAAPAGAAALSPVADVLAFAAARPASVRFAGTELQGVGRAARLTLDIELVAAAVSLGVAEGALARGRAYALERKQFGQAIAEFQAIQWKLADSATAIGAAEVTLLAAAAELERPGAAGLVHQAKVLAAEAAMRAADDGLQIHGGYGYTREFPIERLYREAKVCAVLFGTVEAQRLAIGRAVAASGPHP